MKKQNIIAELNRIGAVKHGEFILKSGAKSPVYVDLRTIISYPLLLREITHLLWETVSHLKYDLVCGVPYTALPLATGISLTYEKPMVLRRKEAKNYGTKKMVEGVYQPGQTCLVVEDVVTTGGSIIETIKDLETEGLQVQHIVAVLDREEGARNTLKAKGYEFHPLFALKELLQ